VELTPSKLIGDTGPKILPGPQTEAELAALQKSVNGGTPYGSESRRTQIANLLRLESTLHPRDRPNLKGKTFASPELGLSATLRSSQATSGKK
jgi:hypothetical protein